MNLTQSNKPFLHIIGNGDVVQNRLWKTICEQGSQLDIFAPDNCCRYDLQEEDGVRALTTLLLQEEFGSEIVWIACPSSHHYQYVDLFQYRAPFLVVEKPIASNKEDLAAFEAYEKTEQRKKTFFLSYYMLEKALPLVFLKRPLPEYYKYLYFAEKKKGAPDQNLDNQLQLFAKCYQRFASLGKLKMISVEILEGEDNRPLPEGGQFFETFIHNMLIAAEFVGLPDSWDKCWFDSLEPPKQEDTAILLNGQKDGTAISLYLRNDEDWKPPEPESAKYGKRQCAELYYEHGKVLADFRTRTVRIKMDDSEISYQIGVKPEYMSPYAIQSDLVYHCFVQGKDPRTFDGLRNQIPVLKWMMQHYFGHR